MAIYLQLLSFIENGRFEEGGMGKLIQKAMWNRLPEQEREFLLHISIFRRFSLQQAVDISGLNAT